ncbi:MAG: response regulator transcription factor [Firmicutes bacterium]|jgi:DNA-binding response OmpR family regulator|nr:response regulator transcription factor [Bacillota bacterium]
MPEKILVVDDEQSIVELIKFNLEREDWHVVTAYDGDEALDVFRREKPDLVLLDIMLPIKDGWQVCRELRETSSVPIIMLTAKGDEPDKIKGLEIGADDYVTKPFSPKELIARVRAALRRASQAAPPSQHVVTLQGLRIDIDRHQVTLDGEPLTLTPKEFDLLLLLVQNKGKVLTRDMLLETVWGYDYGGETRTVDVHIRRLRQKMNEDPSSPRYIHTVHGVGYKVEEPR